MEVGGALDGTIVFYRRILVFCGLRVKFDVWLRGMLSIGVDIFRTATSMPHT